MSREKPLFHCTFSWGKMCRLYYDSLEVDGTSYDLDDLTSIHPTYRRLFGISSARLEISFGLRRLVLRGINDPEVVRQMVAHLLPYCTDTLSTSTPSRRLRSYSSQSKKLVRAQARAWERTNKIPAVPSVPETASRYSRSLPDDVAELFSDEDLLSDDDTSQRDSEDAFPLSLAHAETLKTSRPTALSPLEPARLLTKTALPEFSSPLLALYQPPVSFLSSGLPPLHIPRLQPPLRSVHLINPEQKASGPDSAPVPAIKADMLPVIHLPVRLQPGECAHYSIGATLCSDRRSGEDTSSPVDHGLLILTNRRVFFLGAHSQLTLPHIHLWYVSLLQNSIAFHIERQFRRILIEVEHPEEWASRIEQVASIARRSQKRSDDAEHSDQLLPGLKFSERELVTLKREAIKLPLKQQDGLTLASEDDSLCTEEREEGRASRDGVADPPEVQAERQQREEHVCLPLSVSGIIEAETIELPLQITPGHIGEAETIELPWQTTPERIGEAETIELPLQTTPGRQGEAATIELPSQTTPGRQGEAATVELSPSAASRFLEAETIELFRQTLTELTEIETIELPRQQQKIVEEAKTLVIPKQSEEDNETTQAIPVYKRRRRKSVKAGATSEPAFTDYADDQTAPQRATQVNGRSHASKKN